MGLLSFDADLVYTVVRKRDSARGESLQLWAQHLSRNSPVVGVV
jgi:hypothetical protein